MADGRSSGLAVVNEYDVEAITLSSGIGVINEYMPPLIVSTSGLAVVSEFIPVDPRGQTSGFAVIMEFIPSLQTAGDPNFNLPTRRHPGSFNTNYILGTLSSNTHLS